MQIHGLGLPPQVSRIQEILLGPKMLPVLCLKKARPTMITF